MLTRFSPSRSGFTLVEVLVALVMLTVGALALAATGVANLRLELTAARRVAGAALATTRLEQLRSKCSPSSGNDSAAGITAAWHASASSGVQDLLDSMVLVESPGHAPHIDVIRSGAPC